MPGGRANIRLHCGRTSRDVHTREQLRLGPARILPKEAGVDKNAVHPANRDNQTAEHSIAHLESVIRGRRKVATLPVRDTQPAPMDL